MDRHENISDRFSPEITQDIMLLAANQVVHRLYALIGTIGPSFQSKHLSTQARAKSSSSLKGKIARKQGGDPGRKEDPRPTYTFRDVTDMVGVRVVTLGDNELQDAIQFILQIIDAGRHLPDPLFDVEDAWDDFIEARFIRRNDASNDPYKICEEQFKLIVSAGLSNKSRTHVETALKRIVGEIRGDDLYSSAHLIFNAVAYMGQHALYVPVEFQFRTAAENIWADLIHSFYKIDAHYSWSVRYQALYDRASYVSSELKQQVNELPKLLSLFNDAAEAASVQASIDKFWEMQGSSQEEKLIASTSLCASLFFITHNFSIPAISEKFKEYASTIRNLQEALAGVEKRDAISVPAERARSFVTDAIRQINSISSDLCAHKGALHMGGDDLYASDPFISLQDLKVKRSWEQAKTKYQSACLEKLYSEQCFLLELELLRLRAVLLTELNAYVDEHGKPVCFEMPLPGNGVDAASKQRHGHIKAHYAKTLYIAFCVIKSGGEAGSRETSIFPACMISYFKYKIAREFEASLRSTLVRENLFTSYSLLDTDITLPKWSIYHVLLPRDVAQYRFDECQLIVKELSTPDDQSPLPKMNSLAQKVQTKLIDAAMFAVRAEEEFRKKEGDERYDNRGDLVYGFRQNEQFVDLQLVVDICSDYKTIFRGDPKNRLYRRLLPEQREKILSCVKRLINLLGETPDTDLAELARSASQVLTDLSVEP